MTSQVTRFERLAGLFILGVIALALTAFVAVVVQKGFFQKHTQFSVEVPSGAGLKEGSAVVYRGLKVGQVEKLKVSGPASVRIEFSVLEEASRNLTTDVQVRLVRPFILAEKQVELFSPQRESDPRSVEVQPLQAGHQFEFVPTLDLVDLLSGPKVGEWMDEVQTIYGRLAPILEDTQTLLAASKGLVVGINKNKQTEKLVQNLSVLSQELSKILPKLAHDSPELFENVVKVARNTALITDEVSRVLPLIQSAAPEVPRVSRRAIEALDETVITLKALQKSFLLSGNVKEVRTEEAKRAAPREPAQDSQ